MTRKDDVRRQILDLVEEYCHLAHQTPEFVPFESRVPYAGRVFDAAEMKLCAEALLDFWLTLGPFGERFETQMIRYFAARDFVLVNSGSSANLVAVSALCSPLVDDRLVPGDEIITPAVTFPTTLAPIVQNGLVPVFVDCEPGTYNIDAAQLEAAISDRTRGLMIPHTLGNPFDVDAVLKVARKHHLLLVEDCCDALGSAFGGRLVGSFGDMATLSFYPAHHLTMGEGGGVVVNAAAFKRPVRSIRDWGRDCWCAPGVSNTCGKRFEWELGDLPRGYDHKYVYSHIGYNLKPTDLQAAIGCAQAEKLPQFAERRRRNFAILYEMLEPLADALILPRWHPRAEPSWFGFPLSTRDPALRNRLTAHLETAQIETRLIFGGNILRQPAFRDIPRRVVGDLRNTDFVAEASFFVGVSPRLSPAMVEFIGARIGDFFQRCAAPSGARRAERQS